MSDPPSNGPNGSPARLRINADLGAEILGPAHSGRKLVIGAVLIGSLIGAGLYVAFVRWRIEYRARAAFGANQVAPAIDPMAKIVPPGVHPKAWRQAVADTHAMLVMLTASNLLDRPQMIALHDDISRRVARAQPETVVLELLHLWIDLLDKAGPVINRGRTPFPRLFELAMFIIPLERTVPNSSGIDREEWRRALDETMLMLVAVIASGDLTPAQLDDLGAAIAARVASASPENALAELAGIWSDASKTAPTAAQFQRPKILAGAAPP
jgi:hypothetical protein